MHTIGTQLHQLILTTHPNILLLFVYL